MAETFVNKRVGIGVCSTTLTAAYTVPASTKFMNGTITFCCIGTTGRTVRLRFGARYILYDCPVAAKETVEIAIPHVLNATETLQVQQDVGTDVEYLVSGVEVTGTP